MSYDPVEEKKEEVQPVVETRGTPQGHETREQREEMKALSKEVFGVQSKYQKLFEYDEVKKTKIKETVPGENGAPDTEREVEVPLFVEGTKVKQSRRRYRTVEEVLDLLRSFKAKRDEYMAMIKAQQEEAKKKQQEEEQARKINEELAGSALT